MKAKLKDVVCIITDKKSSSLIDVNNYVSTENILPNREGIRFPAKSLPRISKILSYQKNDVLVSNIRPYFKKIWFSDRDGVRSNDVLAFRTKNRKILLQKYLYLLLQSDTFFDYVNLTAKGTKMPRGDKKAISNFTFELPSISTQKKLINYFFAIESKIKLNNRINDNLDDLLTLIFEKFAINMKFEKSNLVGIANFKNGLPMQKFQCEKFENGIPVLKIRELSQGYTDSSSDRCSMKINKDYIVKTGDIVFSWSGTLMVKIWSGTTSGLNQHLFKVTSKKFPSWFIYEWTKHYLKKFKLIAAGKATTMGHIKRSDLMDSIVFIPNYKFLSQLTKIMKPIYDERIKIIKQNQHLNCLKKEFLTKYF